MDQFVESANNVTPSNATVAQTLAVNVNGPDGDGYAASAVGLAAFDTAAAGGGNIYIRHSNSAGSTTINFATGYTEFTISADPGFILNLDSLEWDSARGGTSGTRGFEVYGAAGATPTIGDLLLDVDAATETRGSPILRSIDLSGAEFQGIESVTFRYYPLTDDDGRSIEIADLVLNGEVTAVPIPEPTTLLLTGLLAAAALATRRRRSNR